TKKSRLITSRLFLCPQINSHNSLASLQSNRLHMVGTRRFDNRTGGCARSRCHNRLSPVSNKKNAPLAAKKKEEPQLLFFCLMYPIDLRTRRVPQPLRAPKR